MEHYLQFVGFLCGIMLSITAVAICGMVCFWSVKQTVTRLFPDFDF